MSTEYYIAEFKTLRINPEKKRDLRVRQIDAVDPLLGNALTRSLRVAVDRTKQDALLLLHRELQQTLCHRLCNDAELLHALQYERSIVKTENGMAWVPSGVIVGGWEDVL